MPWHRAYVGTLQLPVAVGFCVVASLISAGGRDLPTERDLLAEPGLVRTWAGRLTVENATDRADAAAVLVLGEAQALPLLRCLLADPDGGLRQETFEIIRRLGPAAVPLLVEALTQEEASVRLQAVGILIDFAPDTVAAQPALVRALQDEDPRVARDAARALGALGTIAAPAVPDLVRALSHHDEHLRIYAAEALASIGPEAAAATPALAKALDDAVAGGRWAACEALAAIGPPAAPAVPRLIDALKDEFLLVRICAAGALGNIGAKAAAALDPLRAAAADPSLHAEAVWALERITGTAPKRPSAQLDAAAVAPPLAAAAAAMATAPAAGNPPVDWDPATGRNIVWSTPLGDDTFGRPVVAGGQVYVGTDNARHLNPACQDDCGVLMAFGAKDGGFLWQDAAPRVKRGLREFLLPSTTGAALVEGDRLYYMTAECQLRCLDTQGFRDGKNDGPFQGENSRDPGSSDIVWELDLCARLGVFPHEASNSEVAAAGELLVVCTSNGRNEGHTRVPSPRAPSLIAVNKHSGEVVWRAIGPGERVLHGQWCSPVVASVNGHPQVLFGGGDGWLRGFDAATGREIWCFDGNPGDAKWLPRPGVFSRNSIIASPLYQDGRVFLAMGQDPSHGNGPSLLHAVSPNGQGDVTGSRRLWTCREVGRVVGPPVAQDGLLYVGDLGGTVFCLEAASGAVVWKHATDAAIWGCLLLTKDRLYVGNEDGVMTVLKTGRRKVQLAKITMNAPLYARPALVGNALWVVTAKRLYHIAARP
ncbi:MAG: PQQ-binding-like beta-propeller repeat protein [Verrucomicrobia bacterium]|nr:PQQ-binding-like beta-propeller repeat protein [Verrucomicrobiota bacterium]